VKEITALGFRIGNLYYSQTFNKPEQYHDGSNTKFNKRGHQKMNLGREAIYTRDRNIMKFNYLGVDSVSDQSGATTAELTVTQTNA